jgi:hypothetical protein
LFIATSGYGFTHSNVEEEHMTVENGLEALKARSEFAKNIYAVADARISAYDSQAGVLVAAAIAVAGFGVASWGRGGLHVGWFIAAALAAVASVRASVNARAVVPKPVSNALKQRLNDSEKAVADALALQPRDADSTTTSHKVIFNAWHVMSLSSNLRRDIKNRFYSLAVLLLLLELAFLIVALAAR